MMRTAGLPSHLKVALQIVLTLGALTLALWVVYQLAAIVLALIAAALVAYVLAPLVQRAQSPVRVAGRTRRLPRAAAIGLVYVLVAGTLGLGVTLLLPSAIQEADQAIAGIPLQVQSVLTWEHGWSRYYSRLAIPPEVRHRLDDSAAEAGQSLLLQVRASIQAVAGWMTSLPLLVVIPVLAFFLLKDAGSIRRVIVTSLPFRFRLRGHRLFDDLNAMLAAYVRAQLLACALVGTFCGIGFAIIGLPYAVLLGALAGAMEFIPMVGPFLLAALAVIVAALYAPATVLWTIGFLAILRVVEDYVVYPRLIRRGLELHPLAVIVGIMAGAELWGIVGVFLAVPVVATATVVCRHWIKWRDNDLAAAEDPPAVVA